MTAIQAEQHSDPSDLASDLEMQATASAVRDVQKKLKRSQEPDIDGNYLILNCLECGGDIGIGRLTHAIKNDTCIYCATLQERKR